MIILSIPHTYDNERTYICEVVFTRFLGVEYSIDYLTTDEKYITITADNKKIVLPDTLFQVDEKAWLTTTSLPVQPLASWDSSELELSFNLVEKTVPIIYGEKKKATQKEDEIYIPIDVLGSAFFMLSRYEEVVKKERDSRDRFPASVSLAYQENFLERPIVNEYVEILWSAMHFLWPELQRKKREFQLKLSHDVDYPFRFLFMSLPQVVKRVAGDLLKRGDFRLASDNLLGWLSVHLTKKSRDPYNTFELIMDISEKNGLKSTFYFITDHSAGRIDGDYSITHPSVKDIIRKIGERGHKIGLHGSYNTYQSKKQTKKEFERLRKVCKEEGVQQSEWSARQHYLRFDTLQTFQNLKSAGLDADSTLGFADRVGFRAGCCYQYPIYDFNTRKILDLIESPLLVMECTIIDERYMNFGNGLKAEEKILALKEIVRQFSGDFTLLWHNSRLVQESDIKLYKAIVESENRGTKQVV